MSDDIDQLLVRLEAHWSVIEAEITEINKDIAYCEQCILKYGENFRPPLLHLKRLKSDKKVILRSILTSLENFTQNVEESRQLINSLDEETYAARVTRTTVVNPNRAANSHLVRLHSTP